MRKSVGAILLNILFIFIALQGNAIAGSHTSLDEIKKELAAIQEKYESKIAELESKIEALSSTSSSSMGKASSQNLPRKAKKVSNFNPAVSVVLNGKATSFSESSGEMEGFAVGEEGERGQEGLG